MIIHYSCPGCGAEMTYDIKKEKLHCDHCDREMDLSEAEPWSGTGMTDTEILENSEYHCPNCGGVMVSKAKETSTLCAYCGAPMILADRLTGKRHPAKILPFHMDRTDAETAFKKWCRKGRFAPKGFVSAKNIQRLKGMYVPYWLFHFDTKVEILAKATNVRIFRQGDYEITETEFYDIHRAYELQYQNIPYDGSSCLEDEEMAKLEPFNFNELRIFDMPYLAGFESSSYDFDDKELAPAAKDKVSRYASDYAQGAVSGYTTVSISQRQIDFKKEEEEFIFVPIWFVDYNYHGKVYKFMMNGQNGRIAGKPPVSRMKIGIWWAGLSSAFFILSLIVSYFL